MAGMAEVNPHQPQEAWEVDHKSLRAEGVAVAHALRQVNFTQVETGFRV